MDLNQEALNYLRQLQEQSKNENPIDVLIEKIRTRTLCADPVEEVNKILPNFVVALVQRYCESYPFLTREWNDSCLKRGKFPAAIIIVNNESWTPLHFRFIDAFESAGFSVDTINFLKPCETCPIDLRRAGVPTQTAYYNFLASGENVPSVWTPNCKRCNETIKNQFKY